MAYVGSRSHTLTTDVSLQPNNLSSFGNDLVSKFLNAAAWSHF